MCRGNFDRVISTTQTAVMFMQCRPLRVGLD